MNSEQHSAANTLKYMPLRLKTHGASSYSVGLLGLPLRAPNPLIVLEDVVAGYGEKVVLKDVTVSLQSEQRIGLLGINGTGKTEWVSKEIGGPTLVMTSLAAAVVAKLV